MDLEPIQRRKLSHEVLDRLLARIRGGEWPVGEHLPSERKLMETFGVGRPVVREALQSLERMKLISITHGERARVLPLDARTVIAQVGDIAQHLLATSPQTLEHLKEARLFFEVGMVRQAAARATAVDIERLRNAVAAQQRADETTFLKRDMAFHRAIAAISGNPIYAALSEAMFEWLEKFHVSLVRARGAEALTIAEHTAICERIAAHDPDGAATAMTAHLTRANKLYQQLERHRTAKPRARRRP